MLTILEKLLALFFLKTLENGKYKCMSQRNSPKAVESKQLNVVGFLALKGQGDLGGEIIPSEVSLALLCHFPACKIGNSRPPARHSNEFFFSVLASSYSSTVLSSELLTLCSVPEKLKCKCMQRSSQFHLQIGVTYLSIEKTRYEQNLQVITSMCIGYFSHLIKSRS